MEIFNSSKSASYFSELYGISTSMVYDIRAGRTHSKITGKVWKKDEVRY